MTEFIGVVKIGGAEGNRIEPLMSEIADRAAAGEKWVVVHGASGIMDRLCRERGVEIRMITSPSGYRSRFVGEAERAIFEEAAMTYGAAVKSALEKLGVRAEQMKPRASGVKAKRKDVLRENVNGRMRVVRGNYSGTVTGVEGSAVIGALNGGIVPVLPPLGYDAESSLDINIDGDRLSASVSNAIRAGVLIILSNVPGLMKDVNSPESLISSGTLREWEALEHYAKGNMKRKLVACKEALEGGAPKVYLADGRSEAPIERALRGEATCLTR
ncbi:uridylate kinase [Synergistales bacterium]|nr:uridylate kinase [Synergistales bacterium]